MKNRKLVGKRWFTGRDCIGIVLVDNGFELKSYIAKVQGNNEDEDLNFIMDYGTMFPVEEAKSLVGYKD